MPDGAVPDGGPWMAVARVAHLSDLHITDTESPARADFMLALADDPREEQQLPTARPHQITSTHAAAAALRTAAGLAVTGRIDAALLTGDIVDNGQANEFERLGAIITGDLVQPTTTPGVLEGTHTPEWAALPVWRPADPGNHWTTRYGFPADSAIIDLVSQPFSVPAAPFPVLLSRGNHDALLSGFSRWTEEVQRIAVSGRKAFAPPANLDLDEQQTLYRHNPASFYIGAAGDTTADDRRRPVRADAFPLAFGATVADRVGADGWVRLSERVAVVLLDTSDDDGHPEGAVTAAQLAWLRTTLERLSSEPSAPYVIVAAHHGPADHHAPGVDGGVSTGEDIVAVLAEYERVVLWASGHSHVAAVRHHGGEGHRGFWEVTAPAVIDWPCQFQTIEILESQAGEVRILVEKHDLLSAGSDEDAVSAAAALHRLLAANQAGFGDIVPGPGNADVEDYVLYLGSPLA